MYGLPLVLVKLLLVRGRYRPRPWVDPPEDPLVERAGQGDDFLMKTSRVITFVTGTAVFSLIMRVLNRRVVGEAPKFSGLPLDKLVV